MQDDPVGIAMRQPGHGAVGGVADGIGQFLGADPSYVQFDEAIVSNLDLDFKVVFSGSEAASITAFQKAEENKEFLIG